jgi:acyl-coenzyme A synthetase/AMP-(fatty) acid ligase
MKYADFKAPSQSSAWNFLFESPSTSQTFNHSSSQLKGFINTASGAWFTHQQIKDSSTHLSTSLAKTYGSKEGEIISIFSPNSILFPVAMFGIMHAGAIPALSSPGYGVEEMVHVFRTLGCKFIMISLASLDVVAKAATSI